VETEEKLSRIEARLAEIEASIKRFEAAVLPVIANPGKLLGKLMGGR